MPEPSETRGNYNMGYVGYFLVFHRYLTFLFSAHWYLGVYGDTGVVHHVPGDIGCWGDSRQVCQ